MDSVNRRDFLGMGAAAAAAGPLSKNAPKPLSTPAPKILNYNPDMEYRRLGKTGLMVSAVCMGGHWKRLDRVMSPGFKGVGYLDQDFENLKNPAFLANRSAVITHAMECGMNYIDACSPQEILAYSKVLEDRRDRMYFGFSWHTREPRYEEWRSSQKLIEGLEMSLKEARLEYVDLWRISLPMEAIADIDVVNRIEEATTKALETARKQGKARFTGVSSHNRVWLKYLIEHYPEQIQVVLFPYTAASKVLPEDSVFDALKQNDTGAFGIKPFADNSLFAGDGGPKSTTFDEDNNRARLAIRYVLENPAMTAPIPGLATVQQVDNVVAAIRERKREGNLNRRQRSELERATAGLWSRLRPNHRFLHQWECV